MIATDFETWQRATRLGNDGQASEDELAQHVDTAQAALRRLAWVPAMTQDELALKLKAYRAEAACGGGALPDVLLESCVRDAERLSRPARFDA